MTTMTADLTQSVPLSGKNKAGLVICALLGLGDVAGMLAIGHQDSGQAGPPAAVLVAGGILGLITLAAVVFTWRTQSRMGSRIIAGARILSALSSLPAFFVDDVSNALVAVAGTGIVVTLVAIWLVLSRPATR